MVVFFKDIRLPPKAFVFTIITCEAAVTAMRPKKTESRLR